MQFLVGLVWIKIKQKFYCKFICNLNLPQNFHDLIVHLEFLVGNVNKDSIRIESTWNPTTILLKSKITSFWFPMNFGNPCFCQTKTFWAIGHFCLDFFFNSFKGLLTVWSFCWLVSNFPLLEMHVCSSSSSSENVTFFFGSSWIVATSSVVKNDRHKFSKRLNDV
jgi:hypothetical protein